MVVNSHSVPLTLQQMKKREKTRDKDSGVSSSMGRRHQYVQRPQSHVCSSSCASVLVTVGFSVNGLINQNISPHAGFRKGEK